MEYGIWGLHAAGALWGDPRLTCHQTILPPGATSQIFSQASLALNSLHNHHQHQSDRIVDTIDDGPYEAMELTAKSSSTTDETCSEASTPLEKSKKLEEIETNIEQDDDDNRSHVPNEINDNENLGDDDSDTVSTNSSHNSENNNQTNKLDPMSSFGFDKNKTVNPMLNGWVLGAYTAMLERLSAASAALEATELPSLPSDSDSEMSDQSSINEKSRDNSPVMGAPYRGYPCGSCEIVAETRPALKKHILDYHPASSSGSDTGGTNNIRRCPSIGCDFTSTSRCELETHVAAHVGQGMSLTGKKRTLALQRVRYEREEYRCSLCTYACTIEKAFQRHLRAHARGTAPETRVSCAVCGADRSSEVDLSRHMRRHRDDRYFCCDICVFRTVQLKKLIQHRRMHTGEKPHLCPHCAYRSARRDNLRSHVRRVHKKENLYCDTFSPRGMLINPMKIGVDSMSNLISSSIASPSSNTNVAH